jgi:hydrogenase/urease accessory protein HupE
MQFYLDLLTQWGDHMPARLLTLAALLLVPTVALAHPGPAGHTHDLAQSFAQSLGGLDVLMAIAAAGILALAWRVNQPTH